MPEPRSAAPPLLYLHHPKTAGTSFTRALVPGWPCVRIIPKAEDLEVIGPEQAASLRLIAGHFFAHQAEAPLFQSFARITVLRDPLERLVSAWRFSRECVREGKPATPAMLFASKVPFAEFAFSSVGAYERHQILYNLGSSPGEPSNLVPMKELLVRAEGRLGSMLVGTTEALPEFLGVIYARFGRGEPPALQRLVVTRGKDAEPAPLSRRQRAAMEELLAPDRALLETGRRMAMRQARETLRDRPEAQGLATLVERLEAALRPSRTLRRMLAWRPPRLSPQ